MTQDKIREKIKGLLRLASNEGATEAEAASAMNAALALMAKYQISVNLDEANDEKTIAGEYNNGGWMHTWHIYAAEATAMLYSCQCVIGADGKWIRGKGYRSVRTGGFQFIGRSSAVEMCAMTLPWLIAQVEQFYKADLRVAMELLKDRSAKERQAMRADLRKTFKEACAMRVKNRVWRMLQDAKSSDALAIEYGATNALSIINKEEQLSQEREEVIQSMELTTTKVAPPKLGIGTLRGAQAGDRVQLNHAIKEEQLKLT